METVSSSFVILIVILMLIFIVTREFWCWYWKINFRINQTNQSIVNSRNFVNPKYK